MKTIRKLPNFYRRRVALCGTSIVIGLVFVFVQLISIFEVGFSLFRYRSIDVIVAQHTRVYIDTSQTSINESTAPTRVPAASQEEDGIVSNSLPTFAPNLMIDDHFEQQPQSVPTSALVQSIATTINTTLVDWADSTLLSQNSTLVPSQSPSLRSTVSTESPMQIRTPQRIHRNITLIVQLRGELGNQLSVLANARITQLLAQAYHPHIHIQLVGQHQDIPKWTRGRDDLVQCFSSAFHHFDFEGGIHDKSGEFLIAKELQDSWLNGDESKKLNNVRSFNFLDSLLLQQEQIGPDIPVLPSSVSKYSLPYLTATSLSWSDCLRNEWYYYEMREWLTFNMKACCNPNIRPNDNEIVFHYRNYAHELRHKRTIASQYVEISPYVMANVAFQNYTQHDHPRIGITSRHELGTDQYINAFRTRGISSYFVTEQHSGHEGFCFILQTVKETFGLYSSTFYRWSTLLGNARLNRFYVIDSTPVITATAVNNSESMNNSFVNDTITVKMLPMRLIETIIRGNRTFTIEVYRQ